MVRNRQMGYDARQEMKIKGLHLLCGTAEILT